MFDCHGNGETIQLSSLKAISIIMKLPYHTPHQDCSWMTPLKSCTVPQFFNDFDCPPPMLLLSFQTEMLYWLNTPVTVAAIEEMMISKLCTTMNKHAPMHAWFSSEKPESGSDTMHHQWLENSPALSESTLSSLECEGEVRGKIPKPSREVGRPGWGGYNLEEKLG